MIDKIKDSIVKFPLLKLPISTAEVLKAFMNTQLEVLPVIHNGDLKALYFKDVLPYIVKCSNGRACYEQVPTDAIKDMYYIDLKSKDSDLLEAIKVAIENETSVAVLIGSTYIGMVTLKSLAALINEYKIKEAIMTNPLTGLPGNYAIRKEFERMAGKDPFYICYSDLNDFKAYNDKYGVAKGDEVIKFTAFLLTQHCGSNFVGHIGGDDFIFFLPADSAVDTLETIVADFDKCIVDFYSDAHKKQGCIIAANREGKICTFPIMSVSIAAVLVDKQCSYDYINSALAGVKEYAKNKSKQQGRSVYAFDKRRIATIT